MATISRHSLRGVLLYPCFGLAIAGVGCSSPTPVGPHEDSQTGHAALRSIEALRAAFPSGQMDVGRGHVSRLYGPALATGSSAMEAVERVRVAFARAVGAQPDD